MALIRVYPGKVIGDNIVQPSSSFRSCWRSLGHLAGLPKMGLAGLFVGPVIMAALLLVWQQWINEREPNATN
jgi:predicted PurR-regulated permease PerM